MRNFAHLDLNICTHCNNRCTACSHASPFTEPYYMTLKRLVDDLESIKPFMHFNRIQLVGGEPLLHPHLVSLIELAKSSGVADTVSVITNGRLLPKMDDAFWQTVPYIQLSVYANLDKRIIDFVKAKAEFYGFGLGITEFKEFYLQFKPNPTDGVKEFNNCIWKSDCYTVHEGYFFLCPQSAFFPKLFQDLPWAIDGLPLADLTEEKLTAFLNRSNPFHACQICSGGHGKTIPWQESKTKAAWWKESTV